MGLSHIPGGYSCTAAATAARNSLGSHPVCQGEGRGWRASSGGLRELTLTRTLTDFIHPRPLGQEPRQCEGLSSRTGPGPPSSSGGGVSFRPGSIPQISRVYILSSAMPESFKKKDGGQGKGGDGSGTLLFTGRKMQGSKAFFSICSLAIPLDNFRRHVDDITSYN